MKRVIFLLMIVFYCTIFTDRVMAQVAITYTNIESQTTSFQLKDSIDNLDRRVIPIYNDTLPQDTHVLRYGWVDLDFLVKSIKPLSDLKANLMNRINKFEIIYQTEYDTYSDTEKNKFHLDLTSACNDFNTFNKDVWNYCMTPAIELGYIPLEIQLKGSAIGGKINNLPDITWEVCNKLNKSSLVPFMNDKLSKSDLNIAYINMAILNDEVYAMVTNKDFGVLISEVEKRYGNSESIRNKLEDITKEIADKTDVAIKSKCQSLNYDGVLCLSDSSLVPPVILEKMDDITYPIIQHCLSTIDGENITQEFEKIWQEYTNRLR